eukprot:TRINITY_DN30800_c0_g1_i1.p1 TRINITY_DN30800_c0_g1~~TRINITY_DN30800_c0_g1_i1.p1  ORF type:complete len:507 (+),score=83.06 TRINITY_DN30800_c0_g1_i1:52-1572(+)
MAMQQMMRLFTWCLLWAPVIGLETRTVSSEDRVLRRDGAVSSRFNSQAVTEADMEAREERLRRLEAKVEAMAAEMEASESTSRSTPAVTSLSDNSTFFVELFPGGWDGNNLPPPGKRVPAFPQKWFDPRFPYGRNIVLSVVTVILVLLLVCWCLAECAQKDDHKGDGMGRTDKEVEQDTYGFAMVSLIRDIQHLQAGTGGTGLRNSRIMMAIGLLTFTFGLQVFITLQVKQFVTAKWVYGIRRDYEAYQLHMYGEDPDAYTIGAGHPIFPVYAGRRGNPGYFMPGNFVSLDEGIKESVCNIPFSHFPFFICVLLIWSLTCIMEVRLTLSSFRSLILNTKNAQSMKDALIDLDPDIDDEDPENRWVVDGLTISVKLAITFLILIPRLLLVCFLMWLGCRFLAATNDLGEMVLNAVALEFVLLIKDLLYATVVPDRNKREIEKVHVRPSSKIDYASYWSYLGTFSWLYVAIAWVMYYIFLIQMVLPQYRWDVRPICLAWLNGKYGPHA